jgi:hypothetical protein
MKKLFFVVALAGVARTGRAQFFKKLVDNVKQTVQNRANAKADATTNKVLDKADSATRTSSGGSGSHGGAAGGIGAGDTSGMRRVLGAFAQAAAQNPNDTSAADVTMKALGILVGGGGVSAADSARAIQAFRNANGGTGVYYRIVTIMSGSMNRRDTSSSWITSAGEGRKEMTMFGSEKIVTIGRTSMPGYSIDLDAAKKTYGLTVIDTSLLNRDKCRVEKLGTETVAGYPCTHVRLTTTSGSGQFTSSSTVDIWLSEAVPGWSILQHATQQAGAQVGMLKALHQAGVDGLFVKMVAGDGKNFSVTMQLLDIQQKSFPPALFVIPDGYQQGGAGTIGHLFPAK